MHRFPHTKGLEMLANTAVYTAARAQTTVSETSQTERSYLRGGNEDQASVRPFIYKTLDVGKQQSYEPFFSSLGKKKRSEMLNYQAGERPTTKICTM